MPSYSSWNGVKCSASKRLLTEILKQELGFEGFLISDWRAINQVDRNYKTAVKISINAGMDMGMVPSEYKEFSACLKELVEEGAVPVSRIDDAVTRILRVKFAMGLMDKNRSFLADRRLFESFGSEGHRLVARQAVRESIVLLKNKANLLPLSKTSHIHVGGKNADNIGNQCGGWTITWEGRSGNFVPGGTSILSGIRNTMARTAELTFSPDGAGAEGADVGVVVIGEKPYAEGMGDRADLALDKADLDAVDNMKKAGIPAGRCPYFRQTDHHRRRAGKGRCAYRGLASRHRGPRRGRRALRRLQTHGQALVHLAQKHGSDPAGHRRSRRRIRPCFPTDSV